MVIDCVIVSSAAAWTTVNQCTYNTSCLTDYMFWQLPASLYVWLSVYLKTASLETVVGLMDSLRVSLWPSVYPEQKAYECVDGIAFQSTCASAVCCRFPNVYLTELLNICVWRLQLSASHSERRFTNLSMLVYLHVREFAKLITICACLYDWDTASWTLVNARVATLTLLESACLSNLVYAWASLYTANNSQSERPVHRAICSTPDWTFAIHS